MKLRHVPLKSKKPILLACALAAAAALQPATAAPFTPGNLVIERLGDGTQTLGTNGNTIFLDEYTTAGALVQSIAIPTNAANTPMIESGTGSTTGGLQLSPDGQTLSFPGYATNLPNTKGTSTATGAIAPRAIGMVNGAGVYTRVATNTNAFSGSNIRGAVSDGNGNFWASGTYGSSDVNAGIFYFGTNGAATDITTANLRCIGIFAGGLWFSTASSTAPASYGIYEFNGQPTTASVPNRVIPLVSADSAYSFTVNSNATLLYYADSSTGIHKWVNNAGTWSLAYINSNSVLTNGAFGLTADWTQNPPVLYATSATVATTNKLVMLQDTGATATPVVLATAASNTYFRGVAFAPTNPPVGGTPPVVTGIAPTNQIVDAQGMASFMVSAYGAGPLKYSWYSIIGGVTNAIANATNATLTLSNVFGTADGSYYAVVSNSTTLTATSAPVSLSVIDPAIISNPSVGGEAFEGQSVSFTVGAVGTNLTYQWYYSDVNTNLMGALPSTLAGGTSVLGATSATLTLTNVQPGDAGTSFAVVVSDASGSVTSSVVTLFAVNPPNTPGILAFWDFNGPTFNMTNPPPYIGAGSASIVVAAPFSTTVQDANDGYGAPFPAGEDYLQNNTWGTSTYPAVGVSNKTAGVQFNVSTAGARNIQVSYDCRVSPTASDYERLQYTVDGVNWTDYPSSSTFRGHAGTGNGGFLNFAYDLTGFSNVDNNPNFGVRVVTEFQSTATYGVGANGVFSNLYIGTANTYGTGGTVTYDLVTFAGDAITNGNLPPTITGFPTTNILITDSSNLVINFTVGSVDMPAANLTVTAASLNPATVYPTFQYSGTGASRTLTIIPNPVSYASNAAPIMVTVTDTNGLSAVEWFILDVNTTYLPPTNGLTAVPLTNTIANTTLTIPFLVGSQQVPTANLTFSATSLNNTVIPSSNISFINTGTTNPSVVIVPAANEVGLAAISVTVSGVNGSGVTKSSTANVDVLVRPNTNVVLLDYFNADAGGALDGGGFWSHLSGITGQLVETVAPVGGYSTVDCIDNTENIQAVLLNAPFSNSVASTLYASYIISIPTTLPENTGSYFALFNDASGATGDYESGLWVTTNGAATNGNYRVGIQNFPGNGNETFVAYFPMDLVPGSNYVVVQSLAVNTGLSSLWIDPASGSNSMSVSDTTTATAAGATLFNIGAFELRESSSESTVNNTAGIIQLSHLKVGTTFDSVFPSLQIALSGTNVVLNWSDPTIGLASSTNVVGPYLPVVGAQPPYTNAVGTNPAVFFMLGQ